MSYQSGYTDLSNFLKSKSLSFAVQFGKGIYFADLVSKSAQYCYTDKKNPVGLMLLSEVALGEIHELKKATVSSFASPFPFFFFYPSLCVFFDHFDIVYMDRYHASTILNYPEKSQIGLM